MIMTDPIAGMLTRLRNANHAYHDTASMPYSRLKNATTNMLVGEGYLASTPIEDTRVGKTLTLTLKYGSHHESAIKDLQRVSKPGLHMYAKSTNLPKVRGGLGVTILSISSGLSTDCQVTNKGVDGGVLAYIW